LLVGASLRGDAWLRRSGASSLDMCDEGQRNPQQGDRSNQHGRVDL
jgi:hypothetical protein